MAVMLIVPKPLWEKKAASDQQIALTVYSLLFALPTRQFIETGNGKGTPKLRDITVATAIAVENPPQRSSAPTR
jgi:hypothetical protein